MPLPCMYDFSSHNPYAGAILGFGLRSSLIIVMNERPLSSIPELLDCLCIQLLLAR